jgi:hypothetical protein
MTGREAERLKVAPPITSGADLVKGHKSNVCKNPNASRQELAPQIHAISDETHRQIHVLLTEEKELEKAMQEREHNGGENKLSAPPA